MNFREIGEQLDKHPEACRSILRRYESNLNNEVDILNILDNGPCDHYFSSWKSEKICAEIDDFENRQGYGKYLVINDLHEPFARRDLLKRILLLPSVWNIKNVIVLGDLCQMNIASKFVIDHDELIEDSLNKSSEILEVLANQFERVIVVEGNHDKHPRRELMKCVKNGMKRLVKDVSPIQTVINELAENNNISNIIFTYGNELKLGNVIFAHPDDYSSGLGQTVVGMADTYLSRYRNVSAVIIGHTHHVVSAVHRGVPVYENGCLCHELDYIKGAKRRKNLWTTAYGIFTINANGDLVYDQSGVNVIV